MNITRLIEKRGFAPAIAKLQHTETDRSRTRGRTLRPSLRRRFCIAKPSDVRETRRPQGKVTEAAYLLPQSRRGICVVRKLIQETAPGREPSWPNNARRRLVAGAFSL